MHSPSRQEFKRLARTHNLIPVYRDIIADVDTPVSAFQKLGDSENAFLLESAEGGKRFGRYSFLGNEPYLVVTCRDGRVTVRNGDVENTEEVSNPLDIIKRILSQYRPASLPDFPPFCGGAVGYLGYDVVRYFEKIPKTARDELDLPEMVFIFTDTLLIFDHLRHKIRVVANAHIDDETGGMDEAYDQVISKVEELVGRLRQPTSQERGHDCECDDEIVSNVSRDDFLGMVERAREYIIAGDVLQVVLSQRFSRDIEVPPFDIYRALRMINPSPYMYYLKYRDLELIGSSPEPLVKVQGKSVLTCPIAGTRPRGSTAESDARFEKGLLSDEKEKAEHIMLVDLGRNDLGRVCRSGTVRVSRLMDVEKYSHVMHMVSTVEGELADGKTAFDALQAVFPAGTVSGAPKIRAMEIIDELEPTLRGPYAGAVGYFSYSGNLDSCITIRTIVVHKNRAYVQAGAGIVYDSVPRKEFHETANKAQALLGAIRVAEEGLI
ncbi:MAG: anthranilate synthase component I [Actinomycetota bacterium]|nr:anthranilate synthase component I [Actinomycetota bacterium]